MARIARYLEATQTSPDHGLLVHHYRHAGDAANDPGPRGPSVRIVRRRLRQSRGGRLPRSRTGHGRGADRPRRLPAQQVRGAHGRQPRDARPARRRHRLLRTGSPPLGVAGGQARPPRRLCASWRLSMTPTRGTACCAGRSRCRWNGDAPPTDRALRWIEKGLATLPPERPGLAARMLVARCGFLSRLGRYREALTFGDEGLALARQDGDAGLQAYALSLLGLAFSGLGSPGEGQRLRCRGRHALRAGRRLCVVWP